MKLPLPNVGIYVIFGYLAQTNSPEGRINTSTVLYFRANLGMLSLTQVEMVTQFLAAVDSQGSIVRQMIMGAGKTTVVNPLLCMMVSGQVC